MTYHVIVIESDEGFAVSCPMLRGCHSQVATKEEALDNIRIAVREWLDAETAEKTVFEIMDEEVTV